MIRLGTRGSALALAQARLVADLLVEEVELVPIATSGDRRDLGPAGKAARGSPGRAAESASGEPPGRASPTDKSRFTKEIEDALLEGGVDLAVHSAKDVPSELPEGLAIVGVPARADARDALCGARSLAELSEGATVGTSSLRRRAQLLALRPDLDVRELRGNVDTRLRRLGEGGYDALVLAAAGLARLERGGEGAPLDPGELVPAPGQGCLVLEARADREEMRNAAAAITDPSALRRLMAERTLVQRLDASCRTPLGAHAEARDGALRLSAFVGLPDGSHWIRDALDGEPEDPAELGAAVAERLKAAGAAEVLAEAERAGA